MASPVPLNPLLKAIEAALSALKGRDVDKDQVKSGGYGLKSRCGDEAH